VRRRGTLVALGVTAALVGGLVWWDRARPTTDDARAARARLVPGFDRARVTTIELARAGAAPTRLVRDAGGGWWLETPRRRADDARVEAILSQLDFGSVERRVAATAAERARFGLDAPRMRVTAGDVAIAVGGDAPAGRVYATRGGERDVLVVERRLYDVLDVDRAALTSRRLTVGTVDDARAVTVGELAVAESHGAWRIERPIHARARTEAVANVVAALGRATATRLLPDATPANGATPAANGRLVALDGREQARILGGGGGAGGGGAGACGAEVEVARADGARLCFTAASLAPLGATAAQLRETAVLPFAPADVTQLDFEHGAARLSLRRDAGAWRIVAPAGWAGPADADGVREWLDAIAALRPRGATPAFHSDARVRIAAGDDVVVALVRGGAAYRDGEPDATDFGAALDALLPRDELASFALRFRPRRIFAFSADAVVRVTAEEGGRAEEAVRTDRFRLTRPFAADADDAQLARVIGRLSSLRAERFVTTATTPPWPDARFVTAYAADAHASDAGLEGQWWVELGARDATGCLARHGAAPTFRLSREACDDLGARFVTRRLADVAGDRVSAVELTQLAPRTGAPTRTRVERRADGWWSGERRLDAARIDALVAALGALEADEAVRYGAERAARDRATLRIEQAGEPDAVLDFGAREGDHALARRRGRDVVYRIAWDRVDAVFRALAP
jgi:Domain of unknown function (DUF4340)